MSTAVWERTKSGCCQWKRLAWFKRVVRLKRMVSLQPTETYYPAEEGSGTNMVSATVMEAVHVDCICARTSVTNESKATDNRIYLCNGMARNHYCYFIQPQ